MGPTLLEVGVAAVLLTIVAVLFAWFARSFGATSDKRMARMLVRAGVDPVVIMRGDERAIIEDVRRRCRRCQAEDRCERWLDGKLSGSNDFCPNAKIFRELTTREPAVA